MLADTGCESRLLRRSLRSLYVQVAQEQIFIVADHIVDVGGGIERSTGRSGVCFDP